MRRVIAGNWRMHGTSPQLGEIKDVAAAARAKPPAAAVPVGRPSTLIARAALAVPIAAERRMTSSSFLPWLLVFQCLRIFLQRAVA